MADLFSIGEFVSFLQVPEFDTDTAELARDLVTVEIRQYVGPAVFDAMADADLLTLKGVALSVAKRVVLNPSGLRSMQIDDYSETWATETFGDAVLTDGERERIDRAIGRAGAAFTVRPTGQSDTLPWLAGYSSCSYF